MVIRKMKNRVLIAGLMGFVFLTLAGSGYAADKLNVARIFSDGMVLQRNMDVPVWGTTEPGSEVAAPGDDG